MIKYENPNGYIEITNNYFSHLVGHVAQSCFGVTRMVSSNPYHSLKSVIKNKMENAAFDTTDQGVIIKSENGALIIDLYIAVSYGVNINAIADSITHKVRYSVESATGLNVSEVNVHIAGLN